MGSASTETAIGLISPLLPVKGSVPRADNGKVSSRTPEKWEGIVDELLRIRSLQEDWDGQGAAVPLPANVDGALNWVNEMRAWNQAICPSRVVAGVDGEIHLVWQNSTLYLDAEIAQPNTVAWLASVEGQPTRQWTTSLAETWLVGAVE